MKARATRGFAQTRSNAARILTAAIVVCASAAHAATTVPTEVQLPGTQPGTVSQIQAVSRCDNCHGNFSPAGEPWFNWAGSMMAHASRDPIFWAAVAIAEQDFDGAGDLCIRCHVPEGWLGGRSTPTDGSALAAGDADGVQCDVCHRLTNPNGLEHVGAQSPPFVANDGGSPPKGYYGSGEYVIWDATSKLGPYSDAQATHQFLQSQYHRSAELCGTCHDVSNPVVGDLAHNHGAQTPLAPGTWSGIPGAPVDGKAAFNNFPHAYGVVERTFSEHQASAFATARVRDYPTLPAELRDGSIETAYQAALLAGNGGDYADGTPRTFTCQSCHMRPTIGQGCNKSPPVRSDLPLHDLTGGNDWAPDAIQYLDTLGQLRLGGGLSASQRSALGAGKIRAQQNLGDAASLAISDNQLTITNLTGHKLISGYPEGRRMWVRVAWRDAADALIATDGAYGDLAVQIDGAPATVQSLLDLRPLYTPVYEAHGAITQEWASQLVSLGTPGSLPVAYDRTTGAVTKTLGQVAAQAPGTHAETFHFVLNNLLAKDNRIPPWGMRRDDAATRNILPVPADQYGSPGPGGTYQHWDTVTLNPPPGAHHATIELLYQPTSWEYVHFLDRANTGQVAFLADEGNRLLAAWRNTGMAAPYVMASVGWQAAVDACSDGLDNDGDGRSDYPSDPGCTTAIDESEHEPTLPCDDRLDDDGDGLVDYPRDPGCFEPSSALENPKCDDDLDNDGDGFVDWDGGGAAPDPQCIGKPYKNREAPTAGCGLGVELGLVALLLALPAARWRRTRAAGRR